MPARSSRCHSRRRPAWQRRILRVRKVRTLGVRMAQAPVAQLSAIAAAGTLGPERLPRRPTRRWRSHRSSRPRGLLRRRRSHEQLPRTARGQWKSSARLSAIRFCVRSPTSHLGFERNEKAAERETGSWSWCSYHSALHEARRGLEHRSRVSEYGLSTFGLFSCYLTLHQPVRQPRQRPVAGRPSVGLVGIEPTTSALSVLRSNRLSYSPKRSHEITPGTAEPNWRR
jgi:hypothetical protein